MKRAIHIFLIVLCTAGMALCAPKDDGGNGKGKDKEKKDNPHKKNKQGRGRSTASENGTYKVTIVGTFRGIGTAEVTEDSVSFQVDVVASDGASGKFIVSGTTIDGPYFTGTGTAIGRTVNIVQGRLDADKGSRLTATYTGPNGEAGRIIGMLPASED